MTAGAGAIETLLGDLARHPPDRYPVQHATSRFHLGVALADAGALDEAEEALSTAIRLFDGRLPIERAKAANARGAVLRLAGRLDEAAASFLEALEGFRQADVPVEQATALYNLGLVEAQLGQAGAATRLDEARRLFVEAGVASGAAAAARELGGALLVQGRLDEARAVLEDAVAGSRAARDMAGAGLAANLLGLVDLADGRAGEAIDAFRTSAAAHPRRVRPDQYAVARANLALAHEEAGEVAHARQAAGQALAVAEAPAPARETAGAVLARVGDTPGALAEVLERSTAERWVELSRSEMDRWADLDDGRLGAEAEAWVTALAARPAMAEEATASWLGALVELPPTTMERLLAAALSAGGTDRGEERTPFRSVLERAVARFPGPQFLRLSDAVARLSSPPGATP